MFSPPRFPLHSSQCVDQGCCLGISKFWEWTHRREAPWNVDNRHSKVLHRRSFLKAVDSVVGSMLLRLGMNKRNCCSAVTELVKCSQVFLRLEGAYLPGLTPSKAQLR
jgi:hypothetical protein